MKSKQSWHTLVKRVGIVSNTRLFERGAFGKSIASGVLFLTRLVQTNH